MGTHTDLIHRGERPAPAGSTALTTPIYETSTFVFDSARDVERYQEGSLAAFLYSRYENPTIVAVEEKLAAVDGAEASLVFSSGMAATSTAMLALLQAGDEVVCASAIYGGTFHLIERLLSRVGITSRFVSLEELAAPAAVIGPKTRLLWFESPINPTLRCVDIGAVAAACRQAGVVSGFDNTFASPINQQPLALGIDISMQSATKYLNGHSDVTGGVLSGARARAGADGQHATAARRRHGSAAGLRAQPRPEDTAAARGPAQRQRARGRRVPRRPSGGAYACTTPASPRTPTMRSRRGR